MDELLLLVKPKSPSVFHIANYHSNRVFVIIQFCHTWLAWIVCIISSCGQCEAICCKITSILPAGRSLTVCPDCRCSFIICFIIHSMGHHNLSCMLSFYCPEGTSLPLFAPKTLNLNDINLVSKRTTNKNSLSASLYTIMDNMGRYNK